MSNDAREPASETLIGITARIVSAYVGHHVVSVEAIPEVIQKVHASLMAAGQATATAVEPARLQPAISIKKSVRPDYLICLEDGKQLKMLKRHLMTRYDMTPDEYRAKWSLPPDYPMVAPNYAEQRSALAKKIGLGQDRRVLRTSQAAKKKAARA